MKLTGKLRKLKEGEELEVVPVGENVGPFGKGLRWVRKRDGWFDVKAPTLGSYFTFAATPTQVNKEYRLATNLDRILLGINLPD